MCISQKIKTRVNCTEKYLISTRSSWNGKTKFLLFIERCIFFHLTKYNHSASNRLFALSSHSVLKKMIAHAQWNNAKWSSSYFRWFSFFVKFHRIRNKFSFDFAGFSRNYTLKLWFLYIFRIIAKYFFLSFEFSNICKQKKTKAKTKNILAHSANNRHLFNCEKRQLFE